MPPSQKANLTTKQKRQRRSKQSTQEKVFAPARIFTGNAEMRPKKVPKDNGVKLSPCAIKYALAIADPFSPGAKQSCVPRAPSIPSLKNTAVTRITAFVGTSGVGFVLLNPTLANDLPALWYTQATFTGLAVTPLSANNTITTGVTTSNLPLPYNSTSLLSSGGSYQVYGRIVSSGLRIKYTGTTMNESGAYYCYVTPNHDNVMGYAGSASAAGALLETSVTSIDREPCSIACYGINDNETTYSNTNSGTSQSVLFPFSAINNTFNNGYTYNPGYSNGSPIGVIIFTGVAGSSFLVECIQHTEYAGPSAATLTTTTDADTIGFDTVQAAASLLPLKKQESNNQHKSPISLMLEGIKEVAMALKPVAINSLVKYGTAMLM